MSSSLGVRQWFPAGDLARHTREFGIEFVGDDDKEEDGVLKTECVSPPPATLPPIPPLIPLSTEEPLASDDSDEPGAYGGVFMVNSESPVFGDSAVNMCSEKGCCAGDTSQCSVVLDPLPSELLRSLTEDGRISVEKASREQCSSGESVLATQDRIDCAEESRDSRRGARQRKRRRESSGGGKGKRRKRSTSSSTTSSTGSTASRPHHYHHKHHKHRRRLCKTADEGSPPPIPRVNPIFLWVKQDDTRIVEVLCEDYDKRNRIRLTKTPHGWRAIPRTERLASVSQTAPSCTINCSVEAPLDGEQCDNSPIDGSIDHCGATLVPTNVDHPAPVAEDENSTDQVTKEHEEGGGEEEGEGEGESEGEVEAGAEGEGRGEGEGEENDAEEQGEECPETEVNGEDTCHSSTRELQDCTDTEVEEMEPTDLSIPKTITDTDNIPLKTITPILPAALNPHPTSEEAAPTPAHQPKPQRKSMFLESLLSSPRKCYEPPRQPSDEPQPLDLGVCPSRGLGSPTISFSEEKKITATPDSEITLKTKNLKAEDITLKNLLSKHSSKAVERSSTPEVIVETTKTQKSRLLELLTSEPLSLDQEVDPLTQLKKVLSDPELSVPDPMLVPRDQLRRLVASPAREIPRLLSMRPELRIPEALAYPGLVQDPDLLVVSLTHLQRLLQNWTEEDAATCMSLCEYQMYQQQQEATTSELKQQQNGDLAAALNQMLWLPYLTQLETAAMTCGNNQEFLTMLNAVFPPSTYPQIQGGTAQQQQYPFLIPFTLPSTDYKTQLEFQQALLAWHEAMMQAAVSAASVTNNPLPSGKNASGTNSYIKTHHHCPTNGRFPHVARKFNSSSARTSPISPTFQSHAPNATHEYLAANGYTNNHHHQYNQYRSRHHQQQQQQPARNNSGPPKLPKSETQTPIDSDKGPKVTCNSLINILSNPNKQQQQEESVTVKRCLSPTMQSQHSHLLAALGNPPSNLPHLVPIPQGISPPAPIDLSGRRPGDKMAVTTGKLKVKKHLVDPAITPRLLKQEVESISPTDKTSHPQLWHPLFGSLNRMHIMEDEGSKPSATLESVPKASRSPTPCQNAVQAVDSEKRGVCGEENAATATNKDEGQQKSPSNELLETSKTVTAEEKETLKEKEGSDALNRCSSAEAKQDQATELDEKENEASDIVPEAEKMPAESEFPGIKTNTERNNKPQHDDVCSLPPSPEDDDENSAVSSPESQGLSSKRSQETRRKKICSDSDSDTPAIVKKLKLSGIDYEEREHLVNEYVDSASRTGLEEIQKHTEKLQQEINTLNALARAKEHEWNNIIRLKKMKEEMFLRLQRKRQVILLTLGSISKPISTLDWDLSSDMRFGECTDEIQSSRDHSNLKETATRINSKEQNTVSQFGLQPQLTSGVSVLKSNHNQLPVMMVPIVSSGPGGLTAPVSTSSVPSHSVVPSASSLKVPDVGNRDKSVGRIHRPILPKPTTAVVVPSENNGTNSNNNGQNPVIGEGRQGPILDVKSIIADYRSRHPETVPRRGRRLKSSLSPTPNSQQLTDNVISSTRVSGGGGILSMASLALGSGSQMRTGLVGSMSEMGDIGFLLNTVGEVATRQDTSRPSSADSSRSGAPSHAIPESGGNANPGGSSGGISFKDVLVQFAKLSQTEQRHEPLPGTTTASKPPPYPEVTLHPVLAPHSPPHQSPSSSLLHGILTKSNNAAQHRGDTSISARPTTFSPTLARLLTAPERLPNVVSTNATTYHGAAAHVSISDLLSTSKTRNEITITPVAAHSVKAKEEVLLVEEEQEDSADRLVIDESGDGDGGRSRGENEDDQGPEIAAEDVPECQGCHQRAAQFVCAGCGNQWYCSRDCQVSAWDEHSEVCSG